MSKMTELDLTLKALRDAAKSITAAADGLAEFFSNEPPAVICHQNGDINTQIGKAGTVIIDNSDAPEPITLEQVKAVMTAKSREGKTEQMRALILAHGAEKLSDVDPTEYADLLKEAEVL